MIGWDIAVLIILVAVLTGLIYLCASGKSHAFWTGGAIRRAIFEQMLRFIRFMENIGE